MSSTATKPRPAAASAADPARGIFYRRQLSPTEDPYETIPADWRDVVLAKKSTGEVTLARRVYAPTAWSDNAVNTFTQHYLKAANGVDVEDSFFEAFDRIINRPVEWAMRGRTMPDGTHLFLGVLFADEQSATDYAIDHRYALAMQLESFNSPVWYNIGVDIEGVRQTPSACFILDSDLDNIDAIGEWYKTEMRVFKGGSGAGLNLSQIRSSYEGMRGGGKASGPVRYMMAADTSAGTMASGGRSRRAAKMTVLDCDHPDLMVQADGAPGFMTSKAHAERILRWLGQGGFDVSVDSGLDARHVNFQNANNSVRYYNAFFEALVADQPWPLVPRQPDLVWKPIPEYSAREIWRAHAQASWECGDPGIQLDDTVNHWHTTPEAGRINGSNPCSEYMSLDNSPCNLAHSNLVHFLVRDEATGQLVWDHDRHTTVVRLLAIHQTIMAAYGDYPTDKIQRVATGFRQIGQGYTNLGGVLMLLGLSYDSDEGRSWSASISSLVQAQIGVTSAEVAAVWGVYGGVPEDGLPGFDNEGNRKAHLNVVTMHQDFHSAIAAPPTEAAKKRSLVFTGETHIETFHREAVGEGKPLEGSSALASLWKVGKLLWRRAIEMGREYGYANSHWSCIAPMGTTGLTLDHTTGGIEPLFNQQVSKKKVSGDWMLLVNELLAPTLLNLGYTEDEVAAIVKHVGIYNSVVGAPHLDQKFYPVFDTANAEPVGKRFLRVQSHLLMMSAVQPFLSGAISKTVNLPEFATVEDIEQAHFEVGRLGLKAAALYRDGSKATQPLEAIGVDGPPETHRWVPKDNDTTIRRKLKVKGLSIFMHVGLAPNGKPDEVFFRTRTRADFIALLDAVAPTVSLGLQHGTPISEYIDMWLGAPFEPAGLMPPADSVFTSCTSVLDLAAKHLALMFLSDERRHELGIFTREEEIARVQGEPLPASERVIEVTAVTSGAPSSSAESAGSLLELTTGAELYTEIKYCYSERHAGDAVQMQKNASCYLCPRCGESSGCS